MDGTITACHCTCKAGLGEACSHVAATLFFMDAVKRQKEQTACTSLPCQWNVPATSKGQYREAVDIDFSSSAAKKRKVDECIGQQQNARATASTKPSMELPPPTQDEKDALLDSLKATGTKCAVLSLSKYADEFTPEAVQAKLPKPLTGLLREDLVGLEYQELLTRCENLFTTLKCSAEEVINCPVIMY